MTLKIVCILKHVRVINNYIKWIYFFRLLYLETTKNKLNAIELDIHSYFIFNSVDISPSAAESQNGAVHAKNQQNKSHFMVAMVQQARQQLATCN